LGYGGEFKNQKQKLIVLAIFGIPGILFGYFAPLFLLLLFFLLFVDTFFEINKETIVKKAVLFGRITLSKKEINCKELVCFQVVRTGGGQQIYYSLIARFKSGDKLLIYKSGKPALVNALDNVVEKFFGIQEETAEDILKELEDIKKNQLSSEYFNVELIKGQFGKKHLHIKTIRGGLPLKDKKYNKWMDISLIFIFITSMIICFILIPEEVYKTILVHVSTYLLCLLISHRTTHFIINNKNITVKKLIFKKIVNTKSYHIKNISFIREKVQTSKSSFSILYIRFRNRKKIKIFKHSTRQVNDLKRIIENFITEQS